MPSNPKTAPWPVLSTTVERRIEARHHAQHAERLANVTAQVDSSAPEYMHHLDYDAKKAEKQQEREYEIQAENARLYSRLAAIEDFDSSKALTASLVRSSLNSTPGTFHAGPHHCVDHINLTATHNPRSLHYQPASGQATPLHPGSRAGSRAGSRQGSRQSSRHSSANPSPIRGADVLSHNTWTGQLKRTSRSSSPEPQTALQQLSPDPSTAPGTDLSASSGIPCLPPLPSHRTPRSSVAGSGGMPPIPRSRYTSPARGTPEHPPKTDVEHKPAAPTTQHTTLRSSSPARLPPHPPPLHRRPSLTDQVSRSASPALQAPHPHSDTEAGAGLLRLAHKHSGELHHSPVPPSVDHSVEGDRSSQRLSSRSYARSSHTPEPLDWHEQHAVRKAELAQAYLSHSPLLTSTGAALKAVRPSPYTSTSTSNSRSASPGHSRNSVAQSTVSLLSSSPSTAGMFHSGPGATAFKPRPPLPPPRYHGADMSTSFDSA